MIKPIRINIIQTRFVNGACVITYQVPGGHKEFYFRRSGCQSFVKMSALQTLRNLLRKEK